MVKLAKPMGSVDDSEYPLVPEGLYEVVVDGAEQTESKNTGNPMIKLTFKVYDGDYKGSKLFDNLSLQEAALWKLKKFLTCVDVDIQGDYFPLDILEGRHLRVSVYHEVYNGQDRAKVGEYHESDYAFNTPYNDEDAMKRKPGKTDSDDDFI